MELPRIGLVGMGGFALTYKSYIDTVERAQVARQVAQVAIPIDQKKHTNELARLKENGVAIFPSLREMLSEMRTDLDLDSIAVTIYNGSM